MDRLARHREGPVAAARGGLPAAHPEGARRSTPTTCSPTPRSSTTGSRSSTTPSTRSPTAPSGLIDEVATGKVTGEEEYWSHTDLWDFQANVDGARVAFEGVKPIARGEGPGAGRRSSTDPLRRAPDAARPVPRGRRLRLLRRAHPATRSRQLADAVNALSEPLSQADRGGARPEHAAPPPVPADRRPDPPAEPAAALIGGGAVPRGGPPASPGRTAAAPAPAGTGRAAGRRADVVPLPRRAPGRDRHAGPGPAALRGLRRDHRLPRGAGRAAAGLDRRGRADDAGRAGRRRPGRWSGDLALPPDDTGEALGPAASGLTLTFGFGPSLFRDADGTRPVRPGRPPARRRCATCRTSRPTSSTPPAPAATSASRPAPTTRRSPSTPSATSPGSASAPWPCAGRSSASAGPRTTSTAQSTPRNLFGFKDGTANVKAEEPDALDDHVWVGSDDDRRAGVAGGRLLPRRAPDQHDHRGLGPAAARRPGGLHRSHQGRGRPALGRRGVHRARLRHARAATASR